MERIATFEKVSLEQYLNDVSKELTASGIHISDGSPLTETIKEEYRNNVRIPVRATSG